MRVGPRTPPDEGLVIPFERTLPPVIGKLLGQAPMRLVGLGDHHEARGVLVEAMHDAWALHPANAGEALPAMGDERIHQCAVGMAGRRVHDEARGLVDHDDVRILMEDRQGDFLPQRLGRHGLRDGERDRSPRRAASATDR